MYKTLTGVSSRPLTYLWFYREYERQRTAHNVGGAGSFPLFTHWVRGTIQKLHANNPDMDRDVRLLSVPPRCTVLSYKRMKAYGNTFRVKDVNDEHRVSYDSGLISVFEQMNVAGKKWINMGYVGELVDIWELNYGCTSAPIILMKGSWVRPDWRGERATMKRDIDGFMLANFSQRMPQWSEPFVFPSQVEQAFFLDVEGTRGWRVVCHKVARNRRIAASQVEFSLDTDEAFEHPGRQTVTNIPESREYVPLTRVETWEGEPQAEDM